jgi:hypothetical protein
MNNSSIPPIPPPPTRYSKYKLVLALGDKWAAVKQAITANGDIDLWDACQELASDNSLFQAAKQLIITMYPDLDAETILQEAQL